MKNTMKMALLISLTSATALAAPTGRTTEVKTQTTAGAKAGQSTGLRANTKEASLILKDYIKNVDALNKVEELNAGAVEGLVTLAKKAASAKSAEREALAKDLAYMVKFAEVLGENSIREGSAEAQKGTNKLLTLMKQVTTWTSAEARRAFTEDLMKVQEAMVKQDKTVDEAVELVFKNGRLKVLNDC